MENKEIEDLFQTSDAHLNQLREIVQETIRDQELMADNLMNPPKEILTRGQRISDRVARFGGSWIFIISFLFILTAWIVFNSIALKTAIFDPYPFILMNLVLSCIAALQAPIIMMSQNRQEEKDRKRSENDYQVNLKAELEIRSLHQKMDLLLQQQIKTLFDIQRKQMDLLTDISNRINQK